MPCHSSCPLVLDKLIQKYKYRKSCVWLEIKKRSEKRVYERLRISCSYQRLWNCSFRTKIFANFSSVMQVQNTKAASLESTKITRFKPQSIRRQFIQSSVPESLHFVHIFNFKVREKDFSCLQYYWIELTRMLGSFNSCRCNWHWNRNLNTSGFFVLVFVLFFW